jgi:hypothetical protein
MNKMKIFNLSVILTSSMTILSGCNSEIEAKAKKTASPTLNGSGNSLVESTETKVKIPFAITDGLVKEVTVDLGEDFLSTNICSGATIFGRTGTALCGGSTWNILTLNLDTSNIGSLSGTSYTYTAGSGDAHNQVEIDMGADFAVTNICDGKSILSLTGTAACISGATIAPAVAGNILDGKEAWFSDGTKVTGTMANHAALNLDTTAIPGTSAGYYSSIVTTLAASDVCNSKSIFGSVGTAVCNSLFGDLSRSNMYRNPATTQMSQTTETTTSSYAAGYRDIPDASKDDDGYRANTSIAVAVRPTVVCGTTQTTIDARIAHCLAQNGANATWDGTVKGSSGEGVWKLVTRTSVATGSREVWRDERTKLLWGDYIDYSNWCKASGNAQTDAEDGAGTGYCAPGNGNQENPPESLCAETGRASYSYSSEDWTTGVYSAGKGFMGAVATSSSPSVRWRLPTRNDYLQAQINGVYAVLPSFRETSTRYWLATTATDFTHYDWNTTNVNANFARVTGAGLSAYPKDWWYAVRCVGR